MVENRLGFVVVEFPMPLLRAVGFKLQIILSIICSISYLGLKSSDAIDPANSVLWDHEAVSL
jgi:hypothetical protein